MKKIVLLAVILLVAASPAASQQERGGGFSGLGPVPSGWYGNSIALVIGINSYSNGWPSLSAAVSDADRVEQVLRKQGFLVYKLLDSNATKTEILRLLYDAIPPKLSPGDRFLLYFSGHGQTETAPGGQMGYLVPADGSKSQGRDQFYTYLSMQEVRNVLMHKYSAKHVMLVADACFSGLLTGRGANPSSSVDAALRMDGKMALTAGGKGQAAVDGLFTNVFVQGISGRADRNADNHVTFGELAVFAQQRVADRSMGRQNPSYGWWEGEGEMVFRYAPGQVGALIAPPPEPVNILPVWKDMVLIPAGEFQMGSTDEEAGLFGSSQSPQHAVRITRPFWIGATEVTQDQWRSVMGKKPNSTLKCGGDCPVEKVSWTNAVDFSNRLSDREGLSRCYYNEGDQVRWNRSCQGYRLPTEAEWEYAARAGTTTNYYTGRCIGMKNANYKSNAPIDGCRPEQKRGTILRVGTLQPNPWGLYDMTGNVYEWVWDGYGGYSADSRIDPVGSPNPSEKVLRGCAFNSNGRRCRTAYRRELGKNQHLNNVGLRLVKSDFTGAGPAPIVNVPKGNAVLNVISDPWVKVFVDGKEIGLSPLINIEVESGQRQIRLVNQGKQIDVAFDLNFRPQESITIGPNPADPVPGNEEVAQ
jgi:formylglycine-generating enzyme required for sulfatase activity